MEGDEDGADAGAPEPLGPPQWDPRTRRRPLPTPPPVPPPPPPEPRSVVRGPGTLGGCRRRGHGRVLLAVLVLVAAGVLWAGLVWSGAR